MKIAIPKVVGLLLLIFVFLSTHCQRRPSTYDLVIHNGRIINGTGNPWFYGDIGIKGKRIIKIGRIPQNQPTKAVIDAKGLFVSPGFIDMNDHSYFSLLVDGRAESKIRQGVTTAICGEVNAPAPMDTVRLDEMKKFADDYDLTIDWSNLNGYYRRLQGQGISINYASYTSANQIRKLVVGMEDRKPTVEEMQEMKRLVAEAMEQGAFGITTGLLYPPGSFFSTDELVELCEVVAQYGGIYATHVRDEGDRLVESIAEAIEIGKRAHIPVEIYHLKASGRANWGKIGGVIAEIEKARVEGIDVTADQYPYPASSTSLYSIMPQWAQEGGMDSLIQRLQNPKIRNQIRREIISKKKGEENLFLNVGGWDRILISNVSSDENKKYEGKTVLDVAVMMGKDPFDAACDLIIAEKGIVWAIFFSQSEQVVRTILEKPWVSIGSDSEALSPRGILGEGKPHPRSYGSFARILGKYVRDLRLLPLEEAIRKMTSLPAQRLGIKDRGLLQGGFCADLVIFDFDRIIDKATYIDPHQFPEGIEYMIVNGQVVIDKGEHTGALPGEILYGPGYRK